MSDETFEVIKRSERKERVAGDPLGPYDRGDWARCQRCGDEKGPFLALMDSGPEEPAVWAEEMYCRECISRAMEAAPEIDRLVEAVDTILRVAGWRAIREIADR